MAQARSDRARPRPRKPSQKPAPGRSVAKRPVRRRGQTAQRRMEPFTIALLAGLALLAICALAPSIYETLRGPQTMPPAPPLTMEQARAANAAIPFVPGPVRAADPYIFHGTPAGRLQAVDCLATAAIYEAGDDVRAQRAVMQVVLNRVRRPGYPKTVCGVVYQGAALKTGCQFSFACDGSVARRTEHSGWADARTRASHALGGAVFAPVGTATHYHTDWVVPWWASSLDKIAKVRSHIFYRPRSATQAS